LASSSGFDPNPSVTVLPGYIGSLVTNPGLPEPAAVIATVPDPGSLVNATLTGVLVDRGDGTPREVINLVGPGDYFGEIGRSRGDHARAGEAVVRQGDDSRMGFCLTLGGEAHHHHHHQG
jgi:hypothetical protein